MKLFNTTHIYDLYVIANSWQEALEKSKQVIMKGDEKPFDANTIEIKKQIDIRVEWKDQAPFVADEITDEELAKVGASTTSEYFTKLYTKEAK